MASYNHSHYHRANYNSINSYSGYEYDENYKINKYCGFRLSLILLICCVFCYIINLNSNNTLTIFIDYNVMYINMLFLQTSINGIYILSIFVLILHGFCYVLIFRELVLFLATLSVIGLLVYLIMLILVYFNNDMILLINGINNSPAFQISLYVNIGLFISIIIIAAIYSWYDSITNPDNYYDDNVC